MNALIRFPADHPALAGHFPGNPVIPGVLILEKVLEYYHQQYPQHPQAVGFSQVKFIRPLLPEQGLQVNLGPINGNKAGFVCADTDIVYVKGEIKLSDCVTG